MKKGRQLTERVAGAQLGNKRRRIRAHGSKLRARGSMSHLILPHPLRAHGSMLSRIHNQSYRPNTQPQRSRIHNHGDFETWSCRVLPPPPPRPHSQSSPAPPPQPHGGGGAATLEWLSAPQPALLQVPYAAASAGLGRRG